jgi:hypothetical protein
MDVNCEIERVLIMNKKEILIPHRYNVYMQDLEKGHLELELLGFVKTINEAKTMVSVFREVLSKENKSATVFLQHVEIEN